MLQHKVFPRRILSYRLSAFGSCKPEGPWGRVGADRELLASTVYDDRSNLTIRIVAGLTNLLA